MHLSRRSDYALRAMRNLSGLPKGKLGTIKSIAQAESIPGNFLAKILKELTFAGLLVSFKGVKGGYQLARPARKVSYLDVIQAIDGPLHLSLCTEPKGCTCAKDDHCRLHQFWVVQEKGMRNALAGKNFSG